MANIEQFIGNKVPNNQHSNHKRHALFPFPVNLFVYAGVITITDLFYLHRILNGIANARVTRPLEANSSIVQTSPLNNWYVNNLSLKSHSIANARVPLPLEANSSINTV